MCPSQMFWICLKSKEALLQRNSAFWLAKLNSQRDIFSDHLGFVHVCSPQISAKYRICHSAPKFVITDFPSPPPREGTVCFRIHWQRAVWDYCFTGGRTSLRFSSQPLSPVSFSSYFVRLNHQISVLLILQMPSEQRQLLIFLNSWRHHLSYFIWFENYLIFASISFKIHFT